MDAEGEEEAAGDDVDGAKPEDDFSPAWEVLDIAREKYEKQMDGDDQSG
jgi:hypothetical protein